MTCGRCGQLRTAHRSCDARCPASSGGGYFNPDSAAVWLAPSIDPDAAEAERERGYIRGRTFTLTRVLWSIVGDLGDFPAALDDESREEFRALAKRLEGIANQ